MEHQAHSWLRDISRGGGAHQICVFRDSETLYRVGRLRDESTHQIRAAFFARLLALSTMRLKRRIRRSPVLTLTQATVRRAPTSSRRDASSATT